jgi:hypothetical protein
VQERLSHIHADPAISLTVTIPLPLKEQSEILTSVAKITSRSIGIASSFSGLVAVAAVGQHCRSFTCTHHVSLEKGLKPSFHPNEIHLE